MAVIDESTKHDISGEPETIRRPHIHSYADKYKNDNGRLNNTWKASTLHGLEGVVQDMARHILVPMDLSDQADQALEYARTEYPEADITVLHVINPVGAGYSTDYMGTDYWEDWYDDAQNRAEDLFDRIKRETTEHTGTLTTETVTGQPAREIVEYAQTNAIDHIIMGSHGRSGMSRILLGSVAETVVRRSPVPVTVTR